MCVCVCWVATLYGCASFNYASDMWQIYRIFTLEREFISPLNDTIMKPCYYTLFMGWWRAWWPRQVCSELAAFPRRQSVTREERELVSSGNPVSFVTRGGECVMPARAFSQLISQFVSGGGLGVSPWRRVRRHERIIRNIRARFPSIACTRIECAGCTSWFSASSGI